MDVTLEVLERLAIAHPSDAINMIFKLLYRSFDDVRVITGEDCELTWMHGKSHIKGSCRGTDFCKRSFTVSHNVRLTPIITPIPLGINRKYITTKSYHPKFNWKTSNIFNQP